MKFVDMLAPVFVSLCNGSSSKDISTLIAFEVVSITFSSTVGQRVFDQKVRDDHRRENHATRNDCNRFDLPKRFAFHLVC